MTNNNNTPQRPPSDDLQPGQDDLYTAVPTYKFKVWYTDQNGEDKFDSVFAHNETEAKSIAFTRFPDCVYVVKVEQGAVIK
jgi:hypothetical protein